MLPEIALGFPITEYVPPAGEPPLSEMGELHFWKVLGLKFKDKLVPPMVMEVVEVEVQTWELKLSV